MRNGEQKTEICKEFEIANSTLSMIIQNRIQITSIFECSIFEPERKRVRTGKHEDLETAVHIWFKQATSLNAPTLGSLLLEKADELAKQMSIKCLTNPGLVGAFKKKKRHCVEKRLQ